MQRQASAAAFVLTAPSFPSSPSETRYDSLHEMFRRASQTIFLMRIYIRMHAHRTARRLSSFEVPATAFSAKPLINDRAALWLNFDESNTTDVAR
jgi:hypothetical protein